MKFTIKDFYWDGDEFVIETKCGQKHVFKGAYISDVRQDYDKDSGVQVDRMKITEDGKLQKVESAN